MRVLVSWAQHSASLPNLVKAIRDAGHKIVYWVGLKETAGILDAGIVFCDYDDAISGSVEGDTDAKEFLPVGEELLSKLYRVESIVLTMMDRIFDGKNVAERRNIYYKMLRYWNGVIEKYKPEFMIFPNTPHFVYDYILYELARLKGVPSIAFDDTRIPGRLLYFNDFWQGSLKLKEALSKNSGRNFTLEDLSPEVRAYYEPRASKDFKAMPGYVADKLKKFSIVRRFFMEPKVAESIKDFSFMVKGPRFIWNAVKNFSPRKFYNRYSYIFKNNLQKEYMRVRGAADFAKPFVYVPLQVQPERTTSPQGDMFVDQILMIETVSAATPDNWLIYVKEHPVQWVQWGRNFSSSRYKGFYEKIACIPKVRIVPIETSSYELIDQSVAVTAVTGSAGWEAVLRSKPAIVFGSVWYDVAPGIFKANSVSSYKNAVAKIQNGLGVTGQEIINFLKSFDEATIRAFIAYSSGKASNVSEEERMRNISKVILSEIGKI